MKVLVIGSGGREHALVWRLARSASVTKVYATPGNPGMVGQAECLPCGSLSSGELLAVAEAAGTDLTVVGPEAPLVAGVVDAFRAAGRRIFGPSQAAAQLEGSKVFTKDFLRKAGIPTARYETVDEYQAGCAVLSRFPYPVVLKADGLAAGKGVIIAHERAEAEATLAALLRGEKVGEAGKRVVIEEYLTGEEASFIALSDGRHVLPLLPTQDHKQVHDGDTGPNTGGMGAYCDSRILTERQFGEVMDTIMEPTIARMRQQGAPFTGFLYAGLMMTAEGPKVLEFNVRMGDPEAQPIMLRLECDLAEVLWLATEERLEEARPVYTDGPSVCVVVASGGYPGEFRKGFPIAGLEAAAQEGCVVFHAGTHLGSNGLETSGGRVLGVTAAGPTLPEAIQRSYRGVSHIRFEGMHYRTDIGQKGLKRWPSVV